MRAVQPGCSAPCPLSLAVVLCSFGAVFRKSLYLAALGVKKHVTEKKLSFFFSTCMKFAAEPKPESSQPDLQGAVPGVQSRALCGGGSGCSTWRWAVKSY